MKQLSIYWFAAPTSQGLPALPATREDLSKDPGLGPGLRGSNDLGNVAAQAAPEERSSQFVAVTGAESEQTSASGLVIAAYSLFWLFAFGMIWLTFRGQERLKARLSEIESRLPKDTALP